MYFFEVSCSISMNNVSTSYLLSFESLYTKIRASPKLVFKKGLASKNEDLLPQFENMNLHVASNKTTPFDVRDSYLVKE